MIQKVTLKNICSWKGYHEIEYGEGMVLFDAPYGAGKSSLLTDTLDLVFSGSARSKLTNIITRWETEGEVEVFLNLHWTNYKIYFYHRLKDPEDKKSTTKTIWKTYQESSGKYEEIDSTPQKLLGVSYEIVAKKTFLIGQFDLDIFSKAGPTEKYDIIAEAFQISKLFALWELAGKESDNITQRKNQLLETFEGIDTTDFDKKDALKKELDTFYQQKQTKENSLKELRKQKEALLILSTQKSYLEKQEQELVLVDNILKDIETAAINKRKEEVEKLQKSLENQDPALQKKQSLLEANIAKSSFLQEKKETSLQNINEKYLYKINSLGDSIKSIVQQLQQVSIYGNKEVEDTLLQNFDFYNKVDIQEQEQLIQSKEKEQKTLDVEIRSIEGQIQSNKLIQDKIKNIEGSACPTCQRHLSQEEAQVVIVNFENIIKDLTTKKNSFLQNKNLLSQEIEKIQGVITWKKYSDEYLKIKELKEQGVTYQAELKEQKVKKEKELQGLEKTEEEINAIIVSNKKLEQEIDELKKKSKIPEIEARIKHLLSEGIILQGVSYQLERALLLEIEKKSEKEKLIQSISTLKKELKDYDSEKLEKLTDTIEKENEVLSDMNLIYNDKYVFYNTVLQKEEEYNKIKQQVEVLNKKLSIYDRIKAIFWKKGEPRTILQNSILPHLENNVNDILEEIADGLYRVEFKLEALTTQGKESKRNTFDIIVYQQGVDQSYDTLSWGERTNINYAIRLGITATLNDILWQKVSDFLILDETFRGDLDAENGGEALANSVIKTLDSGRFKQIFIITHTEYIKEKLEDISQVVRIQKRGRYSKIIE